MLSVGLLIFTCRCRVQRRKKCLTSSLISLFLCSIFCFSVLFISILQVVVPSSQVGTFCEVIGFLDQISGIRLVSMLLVSSYPLLRAIGINRGHDRVCCCKKTWIVRIYLFIFGAAIVTKITSIAPFFTHIYNPVGGWCLISDEKTTINSGLLN